MTRPIALCTLLALTACPSQTPTQTTALATAIQAGTTLAAVAAANNTTAEKIVTAGALLCQYQGLIAMVAGVNVTGVAAQSVAAVCAGLGAVPAALPAGVAAGSVPVVTAPAVALKPAVS